MEATSPFSSAVTLDHMDSPQQFFKPEELYSAGSPSSAYGNDGAHRSLLTQASPPPVIVHSKPAKKRKSWGQALPEPKTNLPPRKRAKTEDEKEQRRVERIKRNRAAAHNSRERKRQETETLAVALARANAELQAYRDLHGPLPLHIVLPEVTLSTDAETPAPSLVESHGTHDAEPSPASSPPLEFCNTVMIKQEPNDTSTPYLPPSVNALDLKSTPSPLDRTRHSAAMLCDLQCQSSLASTPTTTSPASTSPNFWPTVLLTLTTLQLQMCYTSILLAMWTISPSRMARLMQASLTRSTSRSTISSTIPPLSRWSMAEARPWAATGRSTPRQGALHRAPLRSGDESTSATERAAAARQVSGVHQRRRALGREDQVRDDRDEAKNEGVEES